MGAMDKDVLKTARKLMEKTQQEFVEEVLNESVSRETLSNWEKGKTPVPQWVKVSLADYIDRIYGESIKLLIHRKDSEKLEPVLATARKIFLFLTDSGVLLKEKKLESIGIMHKHIMPINKNISPEGVEIREFSHQHENNFSKEFNIEESAQCPWCPHSFNSGKIENDSKLKCGSCGNYFWFLKNENETIRIA